MRSAWHQAMAEGGYVLCVGVVQDERAVVLLRVQERRSSSCGAQWGDGRDRERASEAEVCVRVHTRTS